MYPSNGVPAPTVSGPGSVPHHHPTRRVLDNPRVVTHTPAMNITPDPMGYISYSQFTTWLQCGEKWRLTKLMHAEEDPSWWLAGGTAVHKATEVIDRILVEEQA